MRGSWPEGAGSRGPGRGVDTTVKQTEVAGVAKPARPAFRRRGRIVFSLLAMLAFVGLTPMATIAWKQIELNREALKTSHQEYQLLLASSIAAELIFSGSSRASHS